jgi:hypothetical protein
MEEQVEAAMDDIRRYVHDHPHATDTISGVHYFWLSGRGAAVSLEALQSALDRLTASQLLEARRVPGGEVIYSGCAL